MTYTSYWIDIIDNWINFFYKICWNREMRTKYNRMFTEQPCVKKPMKYDNPFTRVILQITVYVLGMKNHQTKFYVTKRPMFFPRFSIIVKYLLRHWTDWLRPTNRANIIFFLNNKRETCCYLSNKVSIYHLQFTV